MSISHVSFITGFLLQSTLIASSTLAVGFLSVLVYLFWLQYHKPLHRKATMITSRVYDLCHASETVSSKLAQNPHLSPAHAVKELYSRHVVDDHRAKDTEKAHASTNDLEKAFNCGRWGKTRPSELFLQVSSSCSRAPTFAPD